MSWQLVSVVVLSVSLGAGMLWYERSRPPSQIVALVAVLAALAVAGRIVLAPIPNVVATTDIVIIAGFVLGPAPGFAVGALGGLISNFWLGQGVWTPWQMVAWGMCGVAGAFFWQITRGKVNRWSLAAFCGLAGIAFGAWMNLETMVSFGGEMSLDRYLALEVRAIPFDIAHMTGNIVFALAAGPAMIAALTRFRQRFEWRSSQALTEGGGSPRNEGGLIRKPRDAAGLTLVVLGCLLFAFAGSGPGKAKAAYPTEAGLAAAWLESQQNADGGFAASPGGTSSINITARAMFALAATGTNPLDVKTNATPYGYLINHRSEITEASEIALTILALKTVGQNPRKFKGRNLIKALRKRRGDGSFGDDVNVTAFAVLAFRSVKASKDAQYSASWLRSVQNPNGGWGISTAANSDADSTGTTLMAIPGSNGVPAGIRFLNKIQKKSGGFGNNGNTNSQSTGLVLQGVVAAGRSLNYLKRGGKSGATYLLARQQTNGSIWYSKESDQTRVWVTADATTALSAKPLPISAPPREKKTKPTNNSGGVNPSGTGSSSSTYVPPAGSLASPSTGSSTSGTGGNGGSGNNGGGNGGGSGNGSGNGGNGSSTPSTVTPPTDTTVPVVPVAPTAAVLAASERGPQPSPAVAILIALGVAGILCGGTILLARRFRW